MLSRVYLDYHAGIGGYSIFLSQCLVLIYQHKNLSTVLQMACNDVLYVLFGSTSQVLRVSVLVFVQYHQCYQEHGTP